MRKDITFLTNDSYKTGESINRVNTLFSQKANLKDFKELLSRFDVFSEVETIEKLRDFYLPKINGFIEKVAQYEL